MFDEVMKKAAVLGPADNIHAVEVRRGEEMLFRFGNVGERYPVYSATKSFLSAAVGIAVGEGKLNIGTPVTSLLDGRTLGYLPPDKRSGFGSLTLERLMTMSVGGYPFRPEGENWLKNALSLDIDYSSPRFCYSNIPAYLVGVACENAVGMPLMEYMQPRLLDPLSIPAPPFRTCPEGHFYGATGMELTVSELSRLGRMFMYGGSFDGIRILPEDYVTDAVRSHIDAGKGRGYGYFIWTNANGFSINGKWGQRCIARPATGITVTYLSDLPDRADELHSIMESAADALT